jgi:hypothetical protein
MTSIFSGKHDLESRRAEVIQEMEERLERVGDNLPVHLQIQMRESIAAYKHECATGIKTEWTVIKGHHGSADRTGQAGKLKYPKAKQEWELKTTVIKGRGGHKGNVTMYFDYEKKLKKKV